MEDFIQLKKDNILRIGIKDPEGKDTGEHLEFDLEDVQLPFRLEECNNMHNKNIKDLKAKLLIIEKKQDSKQKNSILTTNEKATLEAYKEFYKKEEEALDLFLGNNGTKKLLNGRNPYLTMFNDIAEVLEPIYPKLKISAKDIMNKIEAKYSKKEDNVL